jgi:glycosyltransferase involved in cell wall biosynthesis
LDEARTRALLAGARALFFPSVYEGFGLPPIEAAALGVPLALSSIAPHQEALGEAGVSARWIGPFDLRGWSEAFAAADAGDLTACSTEERAGLLEKYDFARLGRDMDQIYRRVLEV